MAIAKQTLVDGTRRAVVIATGGGSESNQLFVDASALTNNLSSFSMTTITQDETDFSNTGNEGTFSGGTGHSASDVLTMSDGSTITVDTVSGGIITEFTVTTASTTPFSTGSTLTQSSSTGSGVSFTLTTDTDNQLASARVTVAKLTWSVQGAGVLLLQWDADTDKTFLSLGGGGSVDFVHKGAALENLAAGGTGDILVDTDSNVTGYTLLVDVHKGALGYSEPTLA
jgi:hypothetical protein